MSRYPCRAGLLSLAALLLAAPVAPGQRRNLYTQNPTPRTPNQQQNDVPPPPPSTPARSPAPYVGGYSSYSPYAAATYGPQVVGGYGGYYGGYGYGDRFSPYSGTLQGLASYNQSLGNYQIQIQQARLIREQSRQSSIDTARKQLMWEMEYYEKYRPTAPKLKAEQERADLDWAHNHAQSTEIWSGRTLNVLLKNVLKAPNSTRGPYVTLDERQLSGLNLTDGTTRGNLALAKDQGRIAWPEALQEEAFDGPRDGFEKSFAASVKAVEAGGQPDVKLLRGMRADLKKLEEKLKDHVKALAPSRYIESKRLLNQLGDTVKGFSDERVVKSSRSDWRKSVRTVGDLVAYCQKNGLEFGPATAPGDYPSYTSTYYALRSYDSGLNRQASRGGSE